MPKGRPLDLNEIHRDLWSKADRKHAIRLKQQEMAEALGITKFTMSRTMAKLIEQGRMRRVSSSRQNAGLFVIIDPDDWEQTTDVDW